MQVQPTNLSECVFPSQHARDVADMFVLKQIHQLLISGGVGTGKSTLMKLLIYARIPDIHWHNDVSLINCAVHKTLKKLVDAIDIARYYSVTNASGVKVTVIEQVDKLAADALTALQGLLDEIHHYEPQMPVILLTNNPNKLDDPLLDRVTMLRWDDLPEEGMIKRVEQVLKQNGQSLPRDRIEAVVHASNGGLRRLFEKYLPLELYKQSQQGGILHAPEGNPASAQQIAKPD